MRILAISDEVNSALHSANLTQLTGPVDVLLSCGDLPYDYMEYVVTRTHVRHAFYVHGNHDRPISLSGGRVLENPGGWTNIDRRLVYVREHDLLIAGLEGCIRYKPNARYQYGEQQMARRALRLVPQLFLNRIVHGRYLDILITHAPPQGIHDSREGAHRGFSSFLQLMLRFRPRVLLHGHNHRYGTRQWQTQFEGTQVVNVHPFCKIEFGKDAVGFSNTFRG